MFRRKVRWDRAFLDYARAPHRQWDNPRQADKMAAATTGAAGHFGEKTGAFLERVVDMANRRGEPGSRPVFVVGMGGSGSHWLSGLIAGLPDFAVTREVYFPERLARRLGALDAPDAARAVDAVHLVHALAIDPDMRAEMLVNNARGKLRRYKAWTPHSTVVYLMRDPRHQVMSVTFRKPEYREVQAPGVGDLEYLEANCRANVARYRSMERDSSLIDVRVRYEDLQDDPRQAITAVAEHHGVTVTAEQVEAAARANSPRSSGSRKGSGGVDPDLWHLLGSLLAEPLLGLGYATEEELAAD